MTTHTIITTNATLFDDQGYRVKSGITVRDHGDTISIGRTEHLKEDLIIGDNSITSTLAGWELTW